MHLRYLMTRKTQNCNLLNNAVAEHMKGSTSSNYSKHEITCRFHNRPINVVIVMTLSMATKILNLMKQRKSAHAVVQKVMSKLKDLSL